jgi:acetoacetate decarboxylase
MRFHLEDITLKEAWTGPAALALFPHAPDMTRLPVREVVSALHFKADLALGPGRAGVRLHGEVAVIPGHRGAMNPESRAATFG